jgi:hypothetical protein
VKISSSKLTSDSLPAHDDPTRNSGGRSWEQGTIRHQLQMTLVLIGSPHGETEPRKATQRKAVAIPMTDLARDKYPAAYVEKSGMSKGFWRLKWLHLQGQSIVERNE